ncbi:hypothetical protein AAVH_40770, partial [Aphelenchoides avenae]
VYAPAKTAASLKRCYANVLPTDAVLDHFERLETVEMITCIDYEDSPIFDDEKTSSSFYPVIFATKAFRRVPKFIMENDPWYVYPQADDVALFD